MAYRCGLLTNEFSNVYANYKDRRKTSRGIHVLTNQLFVEVYGDRVQALHLLDCHNKSIILIQNLQLKTIESSVKGLEPVIFHGKNTIPSLGSVMLHLNLPLNNVIQIMLFLEHQLSHAV